MLAQTALPADGSATSLSPQPSSTRSSSASVPRASTAPPSGSVGTRSKEELRPPPSSPSRKRKQAKTFLEGLVSRVIGRDGDGEGDGHVDEDEVGKVEAAAATASSSSAPSSPFRPYAMIQPQEGSEEPSSLGEEGLVRPRRASKRKAKLKQRQREKQRKRREQRRRERRRQRSRGWSADGEVRVFGRPS